MFGKVSFLTTQFAVYIVYMMMMCLNDGAPPGVTGV